MKTRRTYSKNVRPGDTVVFLGDTHVIARVEPYTHPTAPISLVVLHADDGWGMSFRQDDMVVAEPRQEEAL